MATRRPSATKETAITLTLFWVGFKAQFSELTQGADIKVRVSNSYKNSSNLVTVTISSEKKVVKTFTDPCSDALEYLQTGSRNSASFGISVFLHRLFCLYGEKTMCFEVSHPCLGLFEKPSLGSQEATNLRNVFFSTFYVEHCR